MIPAKVVRGGGGVTYLRFCINDNNEGQGVSRRSLKKKKTNDQTEGQTGTQMLSRRVVSQSCWYIPFRGHASQPHEARNINAEKGWAYHLSKSKWMRSVSCPINSITVRISCIVLLQAAHK